jgi:hypothetical protein
MKATYCFSAVIVSPVTLLASVWLCLAGEVNYLEPFDKLPDSPELGVADYEQLTPDRTGGRPAWINEPAVVHCA